MKLSEISEAEERAWIALIDQESIKGAADSRCVSEHTQKNQIKNLMSKLGVKSQIGLVKMFYELHYNIQVNSRELRKQFPVVLFILVFITSSLFMNSPRRPRVRRRQEIENIV